MHRRYSITHRAIQRLRELVGAAAPADDETMRDKLDHALTSAEDNGLAVHTIDAMLGEPQTLIPMDEFGDRLYAIIKEDTVVTVLPEGHGQDILHRGLLAQQRQADGGYGGERGGSEREFHRERDLRERERDDERWNSPARSKWRLKDGGPVVVQRLVRGTAVGGVSSRVESIGAFDPTGARRRGDERFDERGDERGRRFEPPAAPARRRPLPEGPVARAMDAALLRGRRKASITALADTLREALATAPNAELLPLWNVLAQQGVPAELTFADLIRAVELARA